MTKFSSLARARVIGPEGGAWGGGASGGAGEGAAGVDVLVVSSSELISATPAGRQHGASGRVGGRRPKDWGDEIRGSPRDVHPGP